MLSCPTSQFVVRRRLTHSPSRRWRTKREAFGNFLCLSSFSILLRFSSFLFFAYFLSAGPHSKTHATRREIQFAHVPLGRQFMFCQWFFRGSRTVSYCHLFANIGKFYVSDFRGETFLEWPRHIIRRKMCTASIKYWVMAKMKVWWKLLSFP